MTLLLGVDEVSLVPPDGLDEHGWRLPGTDAAWSGVGNLQLQPGITDPRASDGGGRGPYGPARDSSGVLYLPADAPVIEGMVAEVRGRSYALSQVRVVLDPTGSGALTCWVSTATSVDTWPE